MNNITNNFILATYIFFPLICKSKKCKDLYNHRNVLSDKLNIYCDLTRHESFIYVNVNYNGPLN